MRQSCSFSGCMHQTYCISETSYKAAKLAAYCAVSQAVPCKYLAECHPFNTFHTYLVGGWLVELVLCQYSCRGNIEESSDRLDMKQSYTIIQFTTLNAFIVGWLNGKMFYG